MKQEETGKGGKNGFLVFEKSNIISILSGARKAIKSRDSFKLRELSNRTTHSASIYQDADSITLAVLMYSLSKIVERIDYFTNKKWDFFVNACIENLQAAESAVKKEKAEEFRNRLLGLRQNIVEIAGEVGKYIEDVFRRAMVSKASRIYEHGISLSKTAELLGVSAWELADYVGKTGIPDVNLSITQDIKTRISKALKIFGENR